jgi:hypothetical protein
MIELLTCNLCGAVILDRKDSWMAHGQWHGLTEYETRQILTKVEDEG